MPSNPDRKKIAILGGGAAALAAVFELTNQPDWKERFESITVYQLGWRLGGKGASGRGQDGRIEEHGLHIWLGYYENAFRMIQQAYRELDRPATAPLATWDQAFKPDDVIFIAENMPQGWRFWPLQFPNNNAVPGAGGEFPSLWSYMVMMLRLMHEHFAAHPLGQALQTESAATPRHSIWEWLKGLVRKAELDIEATLVASEAMFLEKARKLAEQLDKDPRQHRAEDHHRLMRLLEEFINWLFKKLEAELKTNDEARRLFICLDLAAATIRGLLAEGILFHEDALDALDKYDFREWLGKHGASTLTTDSGLLRGLYDLVFAYRNGDVNRPALAAGAAIRGSLRMGLTYKGAVFWKMQAGMGDTIFAPLYDVLKKRGVEFKFFHRVRELKLSADKKRIEKIILGRQAEPKNGDYQPLFDCKGLPCWPSAPLYDQLVEGEELRQQQINLESFWTPWQAREKEIILEQGKDFDLVIFGISLGSIPYLCPDLIAANEKWKNLVAKMETTRTLAMQLWLKPNLTGLGWTMPIPVMDAYAEPFNTWADMSHLLERENWPGPTPPKNLAYFCGTMPGGIPAPGEVGAPAQAQNQLQALASDWLAHNIGALWPAAANPNNPGALNPNLLVEQFLRVNIDPSERYVLSVPGSTAYRLKAGESGFDNLYLAGDWIDNGINAGCVEAAVISGMLAANAISGFPKLNDIIGFSHP
jgi:uncharacterized protein with NAD-binding domain and iron-sulfur cluster